MSYILHIETATKVCSVALSKGNELLNILEFHDENYSHSEKLNLLIIDLLKESQIDFKQLAAVAISSGPGSYTGLRIGASTAKGICYGLEIPLIAVNTLATLCEMTTIDKGIKVPMIDARRMEVFTAIYNQQNELIKPDYNLIVDENSFSDYQEPIYLFGNGASKLKEILNHNSNIHFLDHVKCSAKGMIKLASQKFIENDFVDVAYFEPNYGKEFYTTMKV